MKTTRVISVLVAAMIFPVMTIELQAVPRMWREACGSISKIDPILGRLELVREDGRIMTITWNSRTVFYRDGVRVKQPTFAKGQKVVLHYRTPLFGERWSTQVRWKSQSTSSPT
jgi:hypothetical protein